VNGNAADRGEIIALPNPRAVSRRSWDNMPGSDTAIDIDPGDSVVWNDEPRPLLKVQRGKNNCRHCQQGKNHGPESYAQTVVHPGNSTSERSTHLSTFASS
jgi:hypothetical protein